MAVPSPSPGKSELRAEALARRRAFADSLTDTLRTAEEEALARLILPHLALARAIGFYHPLRGEISPLPLALGQAREELEDLVDCRPAPAGKASRVEILTHGHRSEDEGRSEGHGHRHRVRCRNQGAAQLTR